MSEYKFHLSYCLSLLYFYGHINDDDDDDDDTICL